MASGSKGRKVLKWIVVIAACYGVLAYIVLPRISVTMNANPDWPVMRP